jgi:ribonuclease M5
MMNARKTVREIIVVEGRYDKSAVLGAVDGVVIETSGYGIFTDDEKIRLLRTLAEKRGLIILTDSDGAGFLIRSHLKGMLGGVNLKHAYIPDIPGREKRKRIASKEGKLGVEGMSRDVILDALVRAGATFAEETEAGNGGEPITKTDFYLAGLSGTEGSAERRAALLLKLGLPERLTANGLLDVLNALYTKEEFMLLSQM